jgi:hypothetical protein
MALTMSLHMIGNTKYKITLLLVFLMLTSGCVAPTFRAYDGNLPPEKIAIIKPIESYVSTFIELENEVTTVKVQGIDSEKIRTDTRKIEVLPGEHQLTCYLEHMVYRVRVVLIKKGSPQTLTFKAEAGHVYEVHGKWNSVDDTPIWIVEKQTGSVVAGDKQELQY